MNINDLEKANMLAKSLIPKADELLNMSSNMSSKSSNSMRLGESIYRLSEYDKEFRTKFMQLIKELKKKLQKEFDEI